MKVKICGIKTMNDALAVQDDGADFIGFVFAPSSRRISPVNAKKIIASLDKDIKTVGVFVNESLENMAYISEFVGLDYIQLHGNEAKHIALALNKPIIKAFSFGQTDLATIRSYPCDYVLIDSPGEKYAGGSGRTFDWTQLEDDTKLHEKLILAGGLNANNIIEAIRTAKPVGVDVSSGVETNKEKDIKKIKAFIEIVKAERKVEV